MKKLNTLHRQSGARCTLVIENIEADGVAYRYRSHPGVPERGVFVEFINDKTPDDYETVRFRAGYSTSSDSSSQPPLESIETATAAVLTSMSTSSGSPSGSTTAVSTSPSLVTGQSPTQSPRVPVRHASPVHRVTKRTRSNRKSIQRSQAYFST